MGLPVWLRGHLLLASHTDAIFSSDPSTTSSHISGLMRVEEAVGVLVALTKLRADRRASKERPAAPAFSSSGVADRDGRAVNWRRARRATTTSSASCPMAEPKVLHDGAPAFGDEAFERLRTALARTSSRYSPAASATSC